MNSSPNLNGSTTDSAVFPPRLNPEVAARKSRLILSLMISLARCQVKEEESESGGDVKMEDGCDGKGKSKVAQLAQQLLSDKVSIGILASIPG